MFPLMKWSPTRELTSLHKDIDELFNRVFGRTEGFMPSLFTERYGFPAIESVRKGGNLVVRAELPGVDPKDVEISVTGNLLTIKGERKMDEEVKREDYYMREIGYGSFERTLTLPEGANTEKIKANYKKGLLEITMPAEAVVKGKKVHIELAEEPKKLKAA